MADQIPSGTGQKENSDQIPDHAELASPRFQSSQLAAEKFKMAATMKGGLFKFMLNNIIF